MKNKADLETKEFLGEYTDAINGYDWGLLEYSVESHCRFFEDHHNVRVRIELILKGL